MLLVLSIVVIPVVFSLLIVLFNSKHAKTISFISALISLAIVIFVVSQLQIKGIQQLQWHTDWLPQLGADFFLKVDGINSILLLLTAISFPFIITSVAQHHNNYSSKLFYALTLLMQSALFGVFIAQNLFLFYIFWELALIPIFFILLLFGNEGKQKITFKFFVYTLLGSLLMLLAIIYIGSFGNIKNFNIHEVYTVASKFNIQQQIILFFAFFIAFAIKIPIFPLHTWQPDTYVNAPTQGTMLLSGIMLKMGLFGIIYWLLPLVPAAVKLLSHYIIILSIISVLYACLMAFAQRKIKRLLAYSSMAHVGLIAAGCFTLNLQGIQGALLQMVAHGINVIAIFYVYDIIHSRTKTDNLTELGGIRSLNPLFGVFFLLILLANIAMPLTNSFVGEFLLLDSLFQNNYTLAALAGLSVIFGAAYLLRTYHKIMHGEPASHITFSKLTNQEIITLTALCGLIIFFGFFPNIVLHISEHNVIQLIEQVNTMISK